MKEKIRNKIKPKKVLLGKKQKRNRKISIKRQKEDEKLRQNEKEEKKREAIYLLFGSNFKKQDFKKICSNLNEKVIDKSSYLIKKPLKEIIDDTNALFKNKEKENKKYIFTNHFKSMKRKILLFYINAIILIILNIQINSSFIIQLTIPGPGISKVFYENPGNSLYYCPSAPTFPQEVFINNIKQENKISEYYLNDTENIVRLEYATNNLNFMCLFYLCSNITKIDFTLFDFSSLSEMNLVSLYHNCTSLTSVDLANIHSPKITYIGSAFKNCISLEYVDLSKLDTKNVETMDNMFYNCKSLTSLDLSNFDFSKVTFIESMFEVCSKLEYINLKNFAEKQDLNPAIYKNILTSLIKNMECPIIYCGDNWKQKQKQMKNCEVICDEDNIFELIETEECVNYCDINKILSGA